MQWRVEPTVDLQVLVSTLGPTDVPGAGQQFDLMPYVRGGGITIRRGRSDELSDFQAGSCSFELRNNNREFDARLTGVALDLPGAATDTATTPDHAQFAITDLDVRVHLLLDDWTPGGFGAWLVGQWPNVSGQNGWVLTINPSGFPALNWTTAGTTTITRTATALPLFPDGTFGPLRVTLDVNNGASGHTVTFYTSIDDGVTWQPLGAPIVTAGTTSIFNATAALTVGGAVPLAGQVRSVELRNGIDGTIVTNPDFAAQPIGTRSFIDGRGRPWTVNGAATVRFDDDASPFASILKPLRRVQVVATHASGSHTIFVGYVDGWPRDWSKTTGTVSVVAHDLLTVLARARTSPSTGVLVLDHAVQGRLGVGRLAGDLPVQRSGDRVRTLLQLAGLAAGSQYLVLQQGLSDVVGAEPTGGILPLIQQAEQAEAGFFFVDRGGVVTFLDRHSRFQHVLLAFTQATFTDDDYQALRVDVSLTKVRNEVKFSRPDGLEQRVTDEASIRDYGLITEEAELPLASDGEVLARAEFWRDRYGRPRDRPEPIVVKPRRDMARLFGPVARLDLLNRVCIERTPLGVPPLDRYTVLVESIEHRITNDDWVTVIGTSPIDVSDGSDFLVVGSSTKGNLDQETLAY